MDWDKLKTFYTVAHCGSISAAQNILHLNQSSISRHIQDLEYRLKASLFNRHKKGVTLTDAGKLLFETTEETVKKMAQVVTLIQHIDQVPHGSLKIVSAAGWISSLLLDSLDEFTEFYPHIKLSITTTDYNPKFHLKEADAAILSYIPSQPSLVQEYLMSFNLELYASQQYLDKFGTPQSVSDLDNHRLITFGEDHMLFSSPMNWPLHIGRKGKLPREAFMRINSGILLHQAAKKGLGIVTLARENYFLQKSPLIRILPNVIGPSLSAYFIYPKEFEGSSTIQALGKHLKVVVKKKEWK